MQLNHDQIMNVIYTAARKASYDRHVAEKAGNQADLLVAMTRETALNSLLDDLLTARNIKRIEAAITL